MIHKFDICEAEDSTLQPDSANKDKLIRSTVTQERSNVLCEQQISRSSLTSTHSDKTLLLYQVNANTRAGISQSNAFASYLP